MDTPIKTWRVGASLTPSEVSSRLGVTVAMWNRWENGSRAVPANRVLEIEALTGVSRHHLRPDVFGAEPQKVSAA